MRSKDKFLGALLICLVLGLGGCQTIHQVPQARDATLGKEGTIIFVRPHDYAVIGTRSLSDYVEVVYEHMSYNQAGLMELRIGLRNRGGQIFYDTKGPNINISAKALFYESELTNGQRSAPMYETNWRLVRMMRGAITDFQVVCPRKGAMFYQVMLSEALGATD